MRRLGRLSGLLWLVLPLVVLQPLWGRWGTAVPLGSQPAATVPLFNVWTAWWNADRLCHGLADYWQSPIFRPTAGVFAFSESQPTLLAVAPLAWWVSPTFAVNTYLYASLVLNGWLGAWLLRRIRSHAEPPLNEDVADVDWLAAAGGVMCLLLPFVHGQIGVLQLVPLWGILWTLGELDALSRTPTIAGGARLGLAFGLTYALCHYYGLFLGLLLTVCGSWWIGGGWRDRRTWAAVVAALVTAAVLIAPIAIAQYHYLSQQRFARLDGSAAGLATTWRDYLAPGGWSWLGDVTRLANIEPQRQFSPGYLKTLVAGIGLAAGLGCSATRRTAACWGLLAAASVVLASAPHVEVGGANLHALLVAHWPGFAHIRTPYRFVVFAQLAVVVLAVFGLRHLQQWWRRTMSPARAAGVMVLVTTAVVTDVLPWRLRIAETPAVADERHWAVWLREHTPDVSVVAGIPFADGPGEVAHEVSARALFHQTVHHRPLIEGYSGYFPQTFRDLRAQVQRFPSQESLSRLELFGARYLVIDRYRLPAAQWAQLADWSDRLPVRYVDAARGVEIRELLSTASIGAP